MGEVAGNTAGASALWLGEAECTLDDKQRLFVPRRFLAPLSIDADGRSIAVLTRGFEGCLFLFSEPGFQQLLARLNTAAFAGAEERRMQRLFFGNSQRTTLDAQGRLMIPEKLKSAIGLERDVVLVGAVDRIEIWSKARWNAFEAANSKDFDRLGEVLREGGASAAAAP
jgi:MraZ protein